LKRKKWEGVKKKAGNLETHASKRERQRKRHKESSDHNERKKSVKIKMKIAIGKVCQILAGTDTARQ
jgi:predicted membrane protein